MPGDSEMIEYKPAPGSKSSPIPHLTRLRDWAESHRSVNMSLLVSSLVVDPTNQSHPYLLGGTLQFISNQETVDLLTHWSRNKPQIGKLAKFAVILSADFPELPRPESSPQIHRQFPGCVPYNFLAAMLSVRRPPGLNVRDLYKLACIRCWVLLKALDMYTQHAPKFDQSVQEVSDFVRMASDGKGDQSKLQWVLDLAEPADDFSQYELLLAAGVEKADSQTAGADPCKRAIRSLLKSFPKKLDLPRFENDGSDLPREVFEDFTASAVQPTEANIFFSVFESDPNRIPFPTIETATPPEIGRESRAIAFQSIEDHQFLPYSWNRPNPRELKALWLELTLQLSQDGNIDRLLAAISTIALICHRSLETVSTVTLGTIASDFWQLDPDTLVLHKAPTRRQNNWQPDGESLHWVNEHADHWSLKLVGPLAQVIGENLLRTPNPVRLTDLWTLLSTETLESSFNQWCKKRNALKRLSSGLLPRASEQAAFEKSLDHVFADMLTRPSNNGITGAGSYASFDMAKVTRSLSMIASDHAIAKVDEASTNGLGSMLNPIEDLLVAAISRARGKILNPVYKKEPPWVHQHNLLTGYMVTVLLAATGARPVTSIFETSAHFNLEEGHVYIEDKVSPLSPPGRSGRIVPLPRKVIELLREVYFPHLRHIAQNLPSTLQEFSTEFKSQLDGLGSTKLPLFFFLRSLPDFAWIQVSETTLTNSNLFDWPLPWNLFRHRLAIKLRELKLDAEIIDAQLGHVEAGSETYGDYSVRCWADDNHAWRSALDTAFEALNPDISSLPHLPIERIRLPASYAPFADESIFGSAAREATRKRLKKEVKARALAEIKTFIGKRPIDSIASADWARLGTQMLLQENNISQPNALIRYETYENFLQDTWRSTGSRPRIKSWVSRKPKSHTAFSAQAVHAKCRLDIVRMTLSNIFETSYVSDLSRSACGALAAIDLSLTSHICDQKVLNAVLQGDSEHLNVIYKGGNAFIEHSDVPCSVDNRPVGRFIVPSRSAPLLTRVLGSGKKLPEANLQGMELSQLLQCSSLATEKIDSTKKLVETIADLVNHENSLEMPGIVAGVLAGRVSTFSLDRNDWYRAISNQSWLPPIVKTEAALAATNNQAEVTNDQLDEAKSEDVESHVLSHSPNLDIAKKIDDSRDEARKLFKEIRACLNTYLKSPQSSTSPKNPDTPASNGPRKKSTNHTRVDNFDRETARRSIRKLLKSSDPKVSTAIYALARWILHLLSRPFGKRLLDVVSVQTYMDALAHGFISFGSAIDIADLDADELTEFYSQVIDPSAYPELDMENESPSKTTAVSRKNQIYVLLRLKEFHEHVAPIYGLELPDWSEIGEGLSGATASPGLITEREYLHALTLICPKPNESAPEKVIDAFILLLTFRFGLRGSEAAGLMKEEWVDMEGAIVVLIASRLHKLKTRASQRQIPLVETLTDFEKSVVMRWINYWKAETKEDYRIPLFFEERTQIHARSIRGIRARLIQVLRTVTGNQHINLHHARHSYGNRCALYLLSNQQVDIWGASVRVNIQDRLAVSKQLLATDQVTRRSIWATARVLGHAGPVTTVGSYLHFLQDYCNALALAKQPHLYGPVKSIPQGTACNLDAWILNVAYLSQQVAEEPRIKIKLTPFLAVRYCELRANGMPADAAADHLNLVLIDAARIEKGILSAGQRLRGDGESADAVVANLFSAHELLSKIEAHRWHYLGKIAKNIDGIYDPDKRIPAYTIGKTRQILLWDIAHVDIALRFVKKCGWDESSVQFYRPIKMAQELVKHAEAKHMEFQRPISDDGKKVFQLDRATIDIGNGKIAIVPSRIAMVRSLSNKSVDTNYELIVIWLAVTLC